MNLLRVALRILKWTVSVSFILWVSTPLGFVLTRATGMLPEGAHPGWMDFAVGLLGIVLWCCVMLSLRFWVMWRAYHSRLPHLPQQRTSAPSGARR